MKRLFAVLCVLLLLVAAAAVAAPFLISSQAVKQQILALLVRASGRKVGIETLSFSLFPALGFTANGVTVAEPDWAADAPMMLQAQSLHLGVELMPLLQMHPQVHIKDLTIDSPVIHLIKRGNRANWQFASQAQPVTRAQASPRKAGSVTADTFGLGGITLVDGSITYDDGISAPKSVTAVNVKLLAPHPEEKAVMDASARYRGENATLHLAVEKPLAALSGKPLRAQLTLTLPQLALSWQGGLAMVNGAPALTGSVHIPELNLPELNAGGQPAPSSASPAPSALPAATGGHWSDAPLPVPGLAALNANLGIVIDKLVLPQTALTNVTLSLLLQNGKLALAAERIAAYEGTLSLRLTLEGTLPAVSFSTTLTGVKAAPLLHDFAGIDTLSGTLSGRIAVTAQGRSERQMVASLGGSGDFHCTEGKYTGANLLSLVRNVAPAKSGTGETDFSMLSGSYTVKNGIVSNSDLALVSQLLHVTGAGTIDLPQWQLHYLLKPELVGTAQNPGGIIVPVQVEGQLNAPKFTPDYQAAIADNLKDPATLKHNLKAVKENLLQGNSGADIKKNLKGLLKGF